MPVAQSAVIHSIIYVGHHHPTSGIRTATGETITIQSNVGTASGGGFGTNAILCDFQWE